MPEINWEETCSKCIYGTTEKRTEIAKGRCAHKAPKHHFCQKVRCWMCDSFVRRWDTKEDLEASRAEHE